MGTLRVRVGVARDAYRIVPGLYCVGSPDADSPVLATANYKLSFDALRYSLAGLHLWILVLDTRGINVWCAAGKGLFSSHEVCRVIRKVHLQELVSHRELILPQLAAPGVAAHEVVRDCGFTVLYGPVQSKEIPVYLRAGKQAFSMQRQVSFSLKERAELVPVELFLFLKIALPILGGLWLIAGLVRKGSFLAAARAGILPLLSALILGTVAGGILVPVLLPWIPGRQFFVKGLLAGAGSALVALFLFGFPFTTAGTGSFLAGTLAVSAWLAMNFTGATPFTSPSGVEKEMGRGIPVLALLSLMGAFFWVSTLL